MSSTRRVLIVDDSVVVRGLVSRAIDACDDLEVAGTASNGQIGVEREKTIKPDVIVMDIEMPVMTGLEAVAEIRKTNAHVPIIMFSTLTSSGAKSTIEALSAGATDYATKPGVTSGGATAISEAADGLIEKIRSVRVGRPERSANHGQVASRPRLQRRAPIKIEAVVVGCSTGGPVALEKLLKGVTAPLRTPMFIVQHMPEKFTAALAERLDKRVASRVVEASHGDIVEDGVCYIAAGGRHMMVTSGRDGSVRLELADTPPINSCRPSVDVMFDSAVDVYGNRLLGAMLTGMGTDGLKGTKRMAELGSPFLAQDEETSVVWGMPGAVAQAGLATEIMPIDSIGARVAQVVGTSTRRTERAA